MYANVCMYILATHLYIYMYERANWEILVACGFVCNQVIVAIRCYFGDNAELKHAHTHKSAHAHIIPHLYIITDIVCTFVTRYK